MGQRRQGEDQGSGQGFRRAPGGGSGEGPHTTRGSEQRPARGPDQNQTQNLLKPRNDLAGPALFTRKGGDPRAPRPRRRPKLAPDRMFLPKSGRGRVVPPNVA